MYKTFLILLLPIIQLVTITTHAQDISQAKKMFYYERWQSAKEGFEKAAGTNAEAAYWLVETLLMMDKITEAKIAIANATAAFSNNALVAVAKGHIELSEGKAADAKSNFEKAIALATSSNRAAVLNAVGRANANVRLKYSIPDYGIAKLKEALVLEPANGNIYINMGDCYRRKLDGGSAVEAYTNALAKDASITAQAKYKIGKVYATQQNCEVFTRYFTEATAADKNFMPAWRELYENLADRESACVNFDKAKTYFDKYLAASDQGNEAELLRVGFAYASKDYNTAIAKAQQLIKTMGTNAPVRLYKLIGYSYYEQKNYSNAVKWLEDYFTKETNADNIVTHNYQELAMAYDAAGNLGKAKETWVKAGDFEIDQTKKWFYYTQAADIAAKMKDPSATAAIYQLIVDKKKDPSKTDYFKCGTAYYQAGNYSKSISVFTVYEQKYPDDWRGPFWMGRNHALLDSLMQTGAAVPYYEKALPMLMKEANTGQMQTELCLYLFAYSINVKKDKAVGLSYLDKVLAIDPTNQTALKYKAMLTKPQ